jgi:hypothetical protein
VLPRPGNDRRIGRGRHDCATAKSGGIPFVTKNSTRSGSLFLSDGQYVVFPVDRWIKFFLSIVLSISRPVGVMILDPPVGMFCIVASTCDEPVSESNVKILEFLLFACVFWGKINGSNCYGSDRVFHRHTSCLKVITAVVA